MRKRTITPTAASHGFADQWRSIVGPGYQFPVATERLLGAPAGRRPR